MPKQETYPLLSVEQAQERVLAKFGVLGPECVPILQALGRALTEDIVADSDVPPLANSAMDGYALRAEAARGASLVQPVRLRVVAQAPAGQLLARHVGEREAVRIMTGAPIPPGADTVVRFEDTRSEGEWVEILVAAPQGSNVRCAGEDVHRGQVVLHAGCVLRPQEIGMLASVGHSTTQVVRRPRVAILATGDEVTGIDDSPRPGAIRDINSFAGAAQVLQAGGEPILLGIARDRTEELVDKLDAGLRAGADLFITSGGVSAGDFDLVKKVLAGRGQIDFWWVNMKPGRPMAFGTLQGVPLLALPGNPVAAMISFDLFARPAMRKMAGHGDWGWPSTAAMLAEAIQRKDGRRHYLRVRLRQEGAGLVAELTGDQGSGILTSMVQADGLAVIPEDCDHLPAGSVVQVLRL